MSGAEKCHCSSVVRSSQFTVRDVGREGSEVSCERAELRSSRGSWSRLRSMLSKPDASRSGKSGLVSSSTRRYLKPETRDWLGSPVRRTRTSGRMRVGPWYGALRGVRHGQGGIQVHQHAPEHGEPASTADDRSCYPNRSPEGTRLVRAFLRTELALLHTGRSRPLSRRQTAF